MSWDMIEVYRKQYKAKVQQRWSEFSKEDLDHLEGKHERLLSKLQEAYGIDEAEAERQIRKFRRDMFRTTIACPKYRERTRLYILQSHESLTATTAG